jgi:hypothetical protein
MQVASDVPDYFWLGIGTKLVVAPAKLSCIPQQGIRIHRVSVHMLHIGHIHILL